MLAFKIFTIFMTLFLIQVTFAKPLDNTSKSVDSSEKKDFTAKQGLMIYVATNFLILGDKYVDQSVKISQQMLKDHDLLVNDKPEVLEFKKNITKFVESYDENKELEKILEIMEIFSNSTDHYFELPKEKETPETLFIVQVLNKYKVKEMEIEFHKDFDKFVNEFKSLFEKTKKELSKPLLDWYGKFKDLNEFDKKFEAFGEFADLADLD